MNVFFSGSSTGGPKLLSETDERLVAASADHFRLLSCHGDYMSVAKKTFEKIIDFGVPKETEFMLDSGAFTAWSKGAVIELEELTEVYDRMIDTYESKIKCVWLINLDKIPAEKGRTATPAELIEAMKISDDNFHVLKERYGKRVLPVYHQNETQEQLLTMAKESDYICISPRNDLPELSRVKWAKEAHDLIPGVKTHGLAATGARMMAEVPWHSVDSATWIAIGAYGGIILEDHLSLRILQISTDSGSIKEANGHFDNLSTVEKAMIQRRFEKEGFTTEDLRLDTTNRIIWNRIQLIRYADRYKQAKHNQSFLEVGLFDL